MIPFEVNVRLAGISDAELIADMSRKTFYDTFAGYNTAGDMEKFMEEQFTRENLINEVSQPGNIFLLAYSDGQPAGYARLRYSKAPAAITGFRAIEIARIYSVTEMIGKGIGGALMRECISVARNQGNTVIWLGVWEKNQRAIDFYKRWDFEKFSEHEFILGSDVQTDWLMKKML